PRPGAAGDLHRAEAGGAGRIAAAGLAGSAALKRSPLPPLLLLLLPLASPILGAPQPARSAELDASLASVAHAVVGEFADKALKEDGLSTSFIEPPPPTRPSGSFRGDVSYYPASVVKVFFLTYYEFLKESGGLKDTPELVRAVNDMITVSSND